MWSKIIVFIFIATNCNILAQNNNTLKLVHVIFRHGDRTLDKDPYTNDPHFNETYYPYGRAQLTNLGKLREYNIGLELRKRYQDFIGDIYLPELIQAHASDVARTQTSLQLCLAALFPPVNELIWKEQFLWQPIYYKTLPENDLILRGIKCQNAKDLYKEYTKSEEVKDQLMQYEDVMNYLTEHTGDKVNSFKDMNEIYDTLKAEDEFGLALPEWTTEVFPSPLNEISMQYEYGRVGTKELKQYGIGSFFEKIITDSQSKLDENLPDTKMIIYSAQNHNLAFILETFDLRKPNIPYGTYILFELHTIDGEDGFKIYYQDYSQNEPVELKLKDCNHFCLFEKFASQVEEYFPTKHTVCGEESN